jgi:hypothetical protein
MNENDEEKDNNQQEEAHFYGVPKRPIMDWMLRITANGNFATQPYR